MRKTSPVCEDFEELGVVASGLEEFVGIPPGEGVEFIRGGQHDVILGSFRMRSLPDARDEARSIEAPPVWVEGCGKEVGGKGEEGVSLGEGDDCVVEHVHILHADDARVHAVE
jgi:hypothetical protein